MSPKLRKFLSAAAAALVMSVAGLAVTTAPVQADLTNCKSGKRNDVRAWGECTGKGKWRLAISCTWAWSGKTGWIDQSSGTSKVELQCGRGSIRSTWIEISG